ncbi:glycoside hydrolase family 16 protein [Dactylosporangium sucinum]|uniref:GH16 domain-containing protein n=1 Tax=Dactylosporangium sucinum TaxID=1424081 RepID=A0A917T3V0_9ACTN|nr:glycoside hydrolase family 16 protein [Dactylosporangium sucinum]GGM08256.1 hypothetical protein GCM10007977_006590 [Dactylosporangium sucinum]
MDFEDHFDGSGLDPAAWLPHYLPAWSSRAATRATYEVRDSCLWLTIPPAQGLWLPGEHEPPLRVSGIQSGNWSGPVGGTRGQQPWRDGAVVREAQPAFRGWTPAGGHLELRARAVLSARTMAAWWLVGLEDEPERCAEICVMEVFGDAAQAVGMGLHAFRDPAVTEDFAAPRLDIDVGEFHTYAVDWTPAAVTFSVDGVTVRSCAGPPTYPMQMMLAVFDFPAKPDDAYVDPWFVIDYISGKNLQDLHRSLAL